MRKAGLEIERASYYFGFILPLVVAVRLTGNLLRDKTAKPRSHMQKHSPLVNGLLASLCKMELPFLPINQLRRLERLLPGAKTVERFRKYCSDAGNPWQVRGPESRLDISRWREPPAFHCKGDPPPGRRGGG